MRRIRVGFVGFGWVGRSVWLPRLERHPQCDVVAVHDPYVPGPQDLGLPGGVRAESLRQLADEGLDLAIVAPPNHLHAEAAGTLLAAGVPVVVEKPLCLSSAELTGLVRHSRDGGVGFQVSRPAPRRRDIERLTRLAADLLVGPVKVHATWLRRRGVPRPGSWYTRRAEAGGGALLDLGWHLADVAAGLLGEAALQRISAVLATGAGASARAAAWRRDTPAAPPRDIAVDVETDGELRAHFVNGSALYLRAAWASEVTVDTTRISVSGLTGDGRDAAVTLETTFGFSPHRVALPSIEVRAGDRIDRLPAAASVGDEYDRQVEAAVALVGRGETDSAELRRGAWVLGLLESAYREAGRPLRDPAQDADGAVLPPEIPGARVSIRL
jgi:oxidoreductase